MIMIFKAEIVLSSSTIIQSYYKLFELHETALNRKKIKLYALSK